jgi:hypothetical protein
MSFNLKAKPKSILTILVLFSMLGITSAKKNTETVPEFQRSVKENILLRFLKGSEISIGTRKNWIDIDYRNWQNLTPDNDYVPQMYSLSYKDLTLAYFRLSISRIFTYEKVYPVGKRSKKTFAIWNDDNKYYEYDLKNFLVVLSMFTGKPLNLPFGIFDIGIGYLDFQEFYTSKLTLNPNRHFDEIYYVTLTDGDRIQVEQILTQTTYAVLQEFYKKIYYVKLYSSKVKNGFFIIGAGEVKTNQPITWYYQEIFGESKAVIVRYPIKSYGIYMGFGIENNIDSNTLKRFIFKKIVFTSFIPIKTDHVKINGFSLNPYSSYTSKKMNVLVLGMDLALSYKIVKYLFLDINYKPELWAVLAENPIKGSDTLTQNIIHRVDAALTLRF